MDNPTIIPYTTEWYNNIRSAIGESACKALWLFVIPDDFELSVAIPVYNNVGVMDSKHCDALLDMVCLGNK